MTWSGLVRTASTGLRKLSTEGVEAVIPQGRFKNLWAAGAACAVVLILGGLASAQMGITPIFVEARAYPGGLTTFKLSVFNPGKEALDCDVRVKGMTVLPGGLPVEVDDAPRSCRDWITVEPMKFTLKAGEGRDSMCVESAVPDSRSAKRSTGPRMVRTAMGCLNRFLSGTNL